MTPIERADELRNTAEAFFVDVKSDLDHISVADARILVSRLRETEGWLTSLRRALDPGGVL